MLWLKYAITYLVLLERTLAEGQMILSCYYIKSGMYVTACNSYCHSSNKTDMKEPDKSTQMIKSVPKIVNEDFREVAVI